ncbi:MAG: 2-C-methyl-D-erythritol 4-phosphate cytidylyltransferase [Lachnospiraceae bacterium]|nr:2-C-methyl-D-erythritol 4-phosphate cytidylyltransferase [Lachnospiraceae bacterium]
MQDRFSAIIVAAGTGRRMNSSVKKQYMEIAGAPVLYHTLTAFEKSDVDEIVIVTGEDEIPYVREQIVENYCLKKVVAICAGGKERCDSVYEGIKQVIRRQENTGQNDLNDYVLIHDGVRPLITPELINSCINKVKEFDAVVPGVPEKDTVKEVGSDMEVTGTPDRKKLYRVQTPQCFKLALINEAFEKYNSEKDHNVSSESVAITDDAMLVEKYTGHRVKIIEGDYRNIKITTPEDIGMAEYFLKKSVRENSN